jgi:uncharacterized protein YyaL (SSP411 family)
MAIGLQEIAIVGPASAAFMQQLNARYMPNKVMQASVVQNEKYPLLQDKPVSPEQTFIYLCHNYACQRPINNVEDFGLLVLNAT